MLKVYMYKVNGELFSCGITDSGRVTSDIGLQTKLCKIITLNGLSQFAATSTVGFLRLLSNRPIHIAVWGNFPFKGTG